MRCGRVVLVSRQVGAVLNSSLKKSAARPRRSVYRPLDAASPRPERGFHAIRGNSRQLENIRVIEYSGFMQSMLREYKAGVFQALAHPTRIAILEILREGEISAGAIQERLRVEQANLSQHLAILRSRQIVNARKGGNQVFYSLRHKVLIRVLDLMRQYFQAHLHESVQMLGEIQAERPGR
jgi:DNA-binding transcriptional ArsR family regulator